MANPMACGRQYENGFKYGCFHGSKNVSQSAKLILARSSYRRPLHKPLIPGRAKPYAPLSA
jgi:hypothetical protein